MKVVLVLTILGCIPSGFTYPSGPPPSACEGMTPSHGVSAQTTTAPYSITVSADNYNSGDNITVTVTATNAGTPFRGFFIQARAAGSTDAHGRFYVDGQTGIKLNTCPGGTNNAVSHSTNDEKTTKMFVWTNPSGSDVTFQATFVNIKTNFWTGVQSSAIKYVGSGTSMKGNILIAAFLIIAVRFLL